MIKLPDLKSLTHEEKDALILELAQALSVVTARVAALEEKLAKNSRNSSKPPSSDGFERKTKSTRKSGGKVGGQAGHKGKTLRTVENPDHVIVHPVGRECDACGQLIRAKDISIAAEKRQVIDLPEIRVEVTEHQVEVGRCACGKVHTAKFPAQLTQVVQYGPRIKATTVYLTQYQQLPMDRTRQVLGDLYGVRVSTGTVQNWISDLAPKLKPAIEQVTQAILLAPVVHFDETSMRVGRSRQWLHSASTSSYTLYGAHAKRGKEGLDSCGILPSYKGIAVHDGWKPYAQYDCKHALCNAHHLRELIFILETTKQSWANEMASLLGNAKKEVDTASTQDASSLAPERITHYREQYDVLVEQGLKLNPWQERDPDRKDKRGLIKQSFAHNLLARLQKYPDEILRFIEDFRVPFDNNLAERDIRMPKLKQKVSGCFRTSHGFEAFCTIRSYISTLRKQQQQLFNALVSAFSGDVPSPLLAPG